jgi:hypothetical protein
MASRDKSLGNAQNKKVPEIWIFPCVLKNKITKSWAK